MSIQHTIEDLKTAGSRAKEISVDDILKFLGGKEFAEGAQPKILSVLNADAYTPAKKGLLGKLGRFAGGAGFKRALRAVPILGTGLVALDAADLVTGDESIGNKAMDAAAMAVGGFLGSAGGPLGSIAGAGLGKTLSDGAQALFGGGEKEKLTMEEAIAVLKAKGVL